jgi:hypothetical protein
LKPGEQAIAGTVAAKVMATVTATQRANFTHFFIVLPFVSGPVFEPFTYYRQRAGQILRRYAKIFRERRVRFGALAASINRTKENIMKKLFIILGLALAAIATTVTVTHVTEPHAQVLAEPAGN